ncbi:MAG: hypothetical protein IT537_22430 [Hyphomicrobiales bacterium]|nr:hypothetical protein [Hyphomicrobiales bacterium]
MIESARGRWFLEEFARRNRNSDTMQVLAAVERIERVIREQRGSSAPASFRSELLEIAATISQTRSAVAALPPAPATSEGGTAGSEVSSGLERLQDLAWTMRERGLDPGVCQQIEGIAERLAAASWLTRPNDARSRQLNEVLQSLEQRIEAMLGAAAEPTPPLHAAHEHYAPISASTSSTSHAEILPQPTAEASTTALTLEAEDQKPTNTGGIAHHGMDIAPVTSDVTASDPAGALADALVPDIAHERPRGPLLEMVELPTMATTSSFTDQAAVSSAGRPAPADTASLLPEVELAPPPDQPASAASTHHPELEPSAEAAIFERDTAAVTEGEAAEATADDMSAEAAANTEPAPSKLLPSLQTVAASDEGFTVVDTLQTHAREPDDQAGASCTEAGPPVETVLLKPAVDFPLMAPAPAAAVPTPQPDPLAALRAMSDAERIAMFS